MKPPLTCAALGGLLLLTLAATAAPIPALILDGQNNHDWKSTTPVIKKILEDSGRFTVEVATAPGKGGDMTTFNPHFSKYKVIVSNYNGEPWSAATQEALIAYVQAGGGFVSVHAADNAFPEWPEYNRLIGVGGWGGRTEKSGPYLRVRAGKIVKDTTPGRGGSHGAQHDFLVVHREPQHPITKGLPTSWRHVKDELYDRLRGPAENVTVLATAFSSKETNGSGEDEPMLMVIPFGKGRGVHTTLGHSVEALKCVGAATLLQRGAEWAATGKVTQKVPAAFPTPQQTLSRE